jgi:hypothetical protein
LTRLPADAALIVVRTGAGRGLRGGADMGALQSIVGGAWGSTNPTARAAEQASAPRISDSGLLWRAACGERSDPQGVDKERRLGARGRDAS